MNIYQVSRIVFIAVIYLVLTLAFAPLSYGPIQVRFAEALTILPYLIPEGIWGLFLGCLLANFFSWLGPLDLIFGSLATLAAAILTRKMPHPFLAPLPPVLINAVVVAAILKYVLGHPFLLSMLYIGGGELLACYFLGLPLLFALRKIIK
jgi:uncharacterized membrane protein